MKKTTLFFLLTLCTLSASARLFSVTATLNGANVVPANGSTATGTLTGTYDDVSKLMSFSLAFSGLSGPVSDGFFVEGAVGQNGTLIQVLSVITSPYSTTIGPFSNSQSAAVLAGNSFVELATFGIAEIRGQLALGMEIFSSSTQNTFYGIGGYSHTDGFIPNGVHKSPYVWSGPSPQNDFTYVATTSDGSDFYGSFGELSTFASNKSITLTFKGNNVRKLGLNVYEEDANADFTGGSIVATVTTNLNNTATLTSTSGARFVGFRVLNQDEYIVSATFSANSGFFTSIDNIMFGDDSPQNVALNFDGVNDYVSTNSAVGDFSTNQDFTVSCWIKPDATQSTSALDPSENDIISKWAGSGTGANNNYPFVIRYLNTTRTIPSERGKILVGQWDGTTFTTIISNAAVNDGNWHHVAFVRGSTGFSLYIDGTLQGSAVADNVNGNTTNTTPLQIGRRGNGQNYFKGEIDEVRIWNIAKTATEIANEIFCKTLTNTTNLQASYNFSNGVPHDNNALINQVQDGLSTNHGTLNNFAKTGDASNFVTGQVKYVNANSFLGSNNGSSWANAFLNLLSALPANTCNDLFDVYVAKNSVAYRPSFTFDVNASFIIPTGMSIYGGFAGTEKSINQRNMALIHTTNETTLTGDLSGNDTPFNFTTNRTDNSLKVVQITGSNASLDGFTIRGGTSQGVNINTISTNTLLKNNKVIDNITGIRVSANNTTIANSIISGNQNDGVNVNQATQLNIINSLIANNSLGVNINTISGTTQTNINNSTIASHSNSGLYINSASSTTSTNTIKNSIVYGNYYSGIYTNGSGTINNTITYSLVQGQTSTANGNLNGNTVNPKFVNPLENYIKGDAGDYRLRWCSLAINAGENTGISPLDLDRKPRNFGGTADMGAYEFLGNMPSQVNNSTIIGTIDSPTYAGGAIQTITSTAKILAPAGAIDFKAPNAIILNPGFEARGMSSYFKAQIGLNQSCLN